MPDRAYTCLIDRTSGAAVRSYISILSLRAATRIKGWNFDWKREINAGKLAFENGYDFIYFDAKTGLINYYRNELGAYATGFGGRMILEGTALKELMNNYFGGGAQNELRF